MFFCEIRFFFRMRFFKSRTSSNFQINFIRFKRIKLKKAFCRSCSIQLWRDFTKKSFRSYPTGMRCLWEISIISLHWERHLRNLLETSQKRWLFWDVFKTSQIHPQKDVSFVTPLRRLKNISKKISYVWHL